MYNFSLLCDRFTLKLRLIRSSSIIKHFVLKWCKNYFSLKFDVAGDIKGSILNNHLKTTLVFGFLECGLCRLYLLYVDDVRIWFFFSFFGGMKIIHDYLSREVSGYMLVMLYALAAWLAFVELFLHGWVEFAILYPGEGVVVSKLRVDFILWILKARVNDLLRVAWQLVLLRTGGALVPREHATLQANNH